MATRIRLESLSSVRTEMAKLYRFARAGQLEIATLSRLIYCLKEIRCCLEAEALERIEQQMAELSARAPASKPRVGGKPQERYGQAAYVQ